MIFYLSIFLMTLTISYMISTFKGMIKQCSSGSRQIAVFNMKGECESVFIIYVWLLIKHENVWYLISEKTGIRWQLRWWWRKCISDGCYKKQSGTADVGTSVVEILFILTPHYYKKKKMGVPLPSQLKSHIWSISWNPWRQTRVFKNQKDKKNPCSWVK